MSMLERCLEVVGISIGGSSIPIKVNDNFLHGKVFVPKGMCPEVNPDDQKKGIDLVMKMLESAGATVNVRMTKKTGECASMTSSRLPDGWKTAAPPLCEHSHKQKCYLLVLFAFPHSFVMKQVILEQAKCTARKSRQMALTCPNSTQCKCEALCPSTKQQLPSFRVQTKLMELSSNVMVVVVRETVSMRTAKNSSFAHSLHS